MTVTPGQWTPVDDHTEIYVYPDQQPGQPITIVVRSRPAVAEYTWRHNRYIATATATRDRAEAERKAARVRTANPGDDIGVVTRSVTEWQETSTDA